MARELGSSFAWRPASNDAHALLEVFGCAAQNRSAVYARPGFALDGHVCMDIGAHIGCFSRYALRHGAYGVAAFEPEAANLELLRENLEGRDRASVFEAAVVGSPDRETVELVLGKDYQGVRGRSPPRPGGV